jgi:hypothetical protein
LHGLPFAGNPLALVQPRCTGALVRWWLAGHVNGGRKELNLSEWT